MSIQPRKGLTPRHPQREPFVIEKRSQGLTLIELVVVVVIVGIMASMAVPAMRNMRKDQQLRSSIRAVADSFSLARAHAIKTGNNVIVVFQNASGSPPPASLATSSIIDVALDGPAASADCTIATTEVVWNMVSDPTISNLSWGTTASLAGGNAVPTDQGLAPSNSANGSTFTDASATTATIDASKFASWVVFQPDGLPRLMDPADCANLGSAGQGGGGIYVTNGRRDYAVVLSGLGTVRVHNWEGTQWSQ
jgi:type IV fimbrial biogenesis protein FimT